MALFLRVIWLNIAKFEIYLHYRYCSNLFRRMRRESEFRQYRCRNSTKVWEREKMGERECMNFGKVITKILTARSACSSVYAVCSKWDVLKKNQLWQYHCRNKRRKKKIVAIVAMHCQNRGGKKNNGYQNLRRN